jgi:UDPglucose--hexose-1-phosphate uridylyltransferase
MANEGLMGEPDLRIDPLTGAYVVVTPWRQHRPDHPGGCPFCPGGLEAAGSYDVMCIPNRWPALPNGRHEVILHSPDHNSSFPSLGAERAARVVELWSARTALLGAREDVGYVFVFENRGGPIGATIDHPHSQILAFSVIPPIPGAELSARTCDLCRDPDAGLVITRHPAWLASVPWAPSWPYEMLIFPHHHVADLPAAGPQLRTALGVILVDCLTRLERLFGAGAPYLLWIHQRPTRGQDWPAAHLHLHLAPVLRGPGRIRHLAAAELGAGVFFDPVDPPEAAAQLRNAREADRGPAAHHAARGRSRTVARSGPGAWIPPGVPHGGRWLRHHADR